MEAETRRRHESHGMSGTVEYSTWDSIKQRCFNKKYKGYLKYGARGITMCDEWANSFNAFYTYMGKRPHDKCSIDRIDNDGNYEPGNCRWATHEQQNRNQRLHVSNKTGITGVISLGDKYRAYFYLSGKVVHLGATNDFFEACCLRKSAEARYWSE